MVDFYCREMTAESSDRSRRKSGQRGPPVSSRAPVVTSVGASDGSGWIGGGRAPRSASTISVAPRIKSEIANGTI